MRLAGKNALVTGAGSGIGRSIALLFAQEGANVAVNDLYPDKAEQTVAEIAKLGRKTVALPADVANFDQVQGMVRSAIDRFGRLDILVSNAGIAPTVAFHEMTPEAWDRMIKVHLYGLFHCCRAVVDHFRQNRSGRIVAIASLSGVTGDVLLVHYSAAKAGMIGFTKALSREVVSHGITVNAIAPGIIDTPILAEVSAEVKNRYTPPIGRLGRPEDIGWAVVYLASDEAEFVTGQVISPNGGAWT
jgi:3-oxoacyl-[acyl-carrier protein] reductase